MKRALSRNRIRNTKNFTTMPVTEVFSIRFFQPGITKRIDEVGYHIAATQTKLELAQLVEQAFEVFINLKKIHT